MFFKRLEMAGFKSFATKTTVEFMPGVTVVVGPNGCGKSNVADSIRWVLGEQSARSLRGGRMGDVIFNGSASLKALGYAQVSLTLSNEDRRLPLDQSEVQITRRLFRTGESEYQLNRVDCRLKDITNLFLDTGVGLDAYSILEQGRVDQIINAKPVERREIFEEAAGISKYKMRRDEALRKLSRTHDDLIRLRDIIVEVDRACNSLKRQAQKAARYRRLKERERDIEQRLLVRRAEVLRQDQERLEAQYQKAEDSLQALIAQLAEIEGKQAGEQGRQQELQKALHETRTLHFAIRSDLERAMHDRDMARERMESARKRLGEIERELESARSRAAILIQTIQNLAGEAKSQESALAEKRENLAQLSRRYEEVRREGDSTSLRAGQLRGEISALTQRRFEVENEEHLAARLLETLEKELQTLAEQSAAYVAEVEETARALDTRRAESEEIETALRTLGEERKAIEAEIARFNAERGELQKKLESLTDLHHQARSRLAALRELEEAYEGYYRGVKEVLKASRANRLAGIVGAVSSLIQVRKEHEIAIEVALGSQVQDIVTATVEEAKAAIEFLKRGNLGRATFLPLDFLESDLRDESLRPLLGRAGVVGFARELVGYEPRLDIVARHLFGTTLVVNDIDVAIGLKREGHRTRFVTLDGELVHPRGVLTGGSVQSRGLLSRVREIRQLEEDVKRTDAELAEMRANLQSTNDRLNVAYARSAELQQRIHEQELRRNSALKDLEAVNAVLRERRNQLAQTEARQARQRAERARHDETIQRCRDLSGQLAVQVEEKKAELSALEGDLRRRQEEVESLGQAVAERRVEVTSLAERLTALREKIGGLEGDLQTAREDQDVKAAESEELKEDIEVQAARVLESEERIAELTRRAEEQERSISLHSHDLETLEVEMRRMSARIQELSRDRNEQDNEAREQELRLAEVRAQSDYIEREAQEKFGLGIAQVREELEARCRADRIESASGFRIEESEEAGEEAGEPEAAATETQTAGADLAGAEMAAASASAEAKSGAASKNSASEEDLSDPGVLRQLLAEVRDKLARLGNVNTTAIEEYEEKRTRLEFLATQEKDLSQAKQSLEDTIRSLDQTCAQMFHEAFGQIRENFVNTFRRLFNGGRADLVLQEPEPGSDQLEAGIEILAQPPGKKLQSITLMSGGEKALTAVGLLFALFLHKPSPFCILDEIDAPLDDVNVGRFCDMLKEFAKNTQFIIITHNKLSMSLADTIYGVTMQEPGVSKIVSVKFEEAAADRLLTGQVAG